CDGIFLVLLYLMIENLNMRETLFVN
ncbi:hypothetical protein NPIL_329381, partial [Nephila pilipes]